MKRKICVFSGKRGGLGAFLPLMRLIENDPGLKLQILLGDMHASKEFGETIQEAEKFFPASQIAVINMGTGRGDSVLIRAENLGICLQKAAGILNQLKPDIILVHADRGEHLMVAFAALNLGIPIAHTQGGDVSGNIDDIQRHAITKLAHLHFPETKSAAERIEKLGEEKWRIHVVGSTYIDRIVKKMYTPAKEARKKYGLSDDDDFFIVLMHPDTFLDKAENYYQAKAVLEAVGGFGRKAIIIYPCSDPGYQGVINAIEETRQNPQFMIFKNIENLDFLGLMSEASAIVGNSSAALVEAPYFQLPAINIGKRQMGREREDNVVDAPADPQRIGKKIRHVLMDQRFKKKLALCGRRLGDGMASERIVKTLKGVELNGELFRKRLV